MHLKVTGDFPLFAAINKANSDKFFCVWEVNGAIPLGSLRHREALKTLLRRDHVDDVVIFGLDPQTGIPTPDVIDPSLTCYDLKLTEGTMVYLSINPSAVMPNWSVDSFETPWAPLASSALRFASCGEALVIDPISRRRVTKVGPDRWGDAAVCNTTLSNDDVCRWSFRIRIADESDGGDDLLHLDVKGANDKEAPVLASSKVFPIVAVGVADDDAPIESDRLLGVYPCAWMLDVVSGAFYSGVDPRPLFVDPHNYNVFDGMILTFLFDTEKCVLNVVLNGCCVLVANISKMMAGQLHPVVELYSTGAVVELM